MKKKTLRKIISLMLLLTTLAGDILMPAARSVKASEGAAVSGESVGPEASGESVGPEASGESVGPEVSGEGAGPEASGSDADPGVTAPAEGTTDGGEITMPVASGADDYTGGDGGEEPEPDTETGIRQQTVWYWHKGLPPQDGRDYPVLLCWDDKYYMAVDASALRFLTTQGNDGAYQVNFGINATGYTNSDWAKGGNGCPTGKYRIELGYPTSPTSDPNTVADLDFDYDVLKSTGTAVSFSLPNLPVMRRAAKETPDPLTGLTADDLADRVFIGIKPTQEMITDAHTNVFVADETNWLVGFRYMDYRVTTDSFLGISYDDKQKRIFRWYLYPVNSLTYNRLTQLMPGSFQNLKSGSSLADFMNKNVNNMSWYVSQRQDNGPKSVLTTKGFKTQEGRISHSFSYADELERLTKLDANIALGHSGRMIASLGNRLVYPDARVNGVIGVDALTVKKFEFDIYYGEPNLMYFLKSDIVVENGQTQNLDGPLVIEEGTRITVKNGGVLSLTDWVVNQGEIIIEKGGSLVVQPNTTANGYTRYCALVGNNRNETAGGRVTCNGIMIIMPGCTVAGAGLYGVEFGPGAQCANYGSLIAERLRAVTDRTLENRASSSFVYEGWSVIDSGYYLTSLTPAENPVCLGSYYTPYTGTFNPSGWIYGKYATNYRNKQEYLLPDEPAPVIIEP